MKKAINSSKMKTVNRRIVLECIRREHISRADIAEKTHLTRPSITIIVEELLNEGLLRESRSESNEVGRHPVLLSIEEDARFIVGIALKRNACHVGIVNLGGNLLRKRVIEYSNDLTDCLDRIAVAARAMLREMAINSNRVLGIGISAPGPLNAREGVILNPPKFDLWHNVPIAKELSDRIGYKAYLEHDADSIALEEKYFGKMSNETDFVVIVSENGVGASLVLNDRLFFGKHGRTGEAGHLSIQYDGPRCACGNHGCFEMYATPECLLKGSSFKNVAELMSAAGSEEADRLIQKEAEYFTLLINNYINLTGITRVVIRGDLAINSKPLVDRINKNLCDRRLSSGEFCLASELSCTARTAAMNVFREFFL